MSKQLEINYNYDKQIETFFQSVENMDHKKLEEKVKKTHSKSIKAHKFTQEKPYRLTEEQYKLTPKMQSIHVSDNKETVTILFSGSPNLKVIKNIFHLYSAKYNDSFIDGQYPITTLKIEKNALQALAHLMVIYKSISTEAAALIWEALLLVTEYSLDLESLESQTSWKEHISYQLDAWANADEEEFSTDIISLAELTKYYDLKAKAHYVGLPDEEKENFLEAIISQSVKSLAQQVVDFIASRKYQTINLAFDSVEKCNAFIAINKPSAINTLNQIQDITRKELESLLEPGLLENILNANKETKHAKVASSGIKSTMSILKDLVHDIPLMKAILKVTDITNIIVSAIHFTNAAHSPNLIPTSEEIIEISDKFICMNLICNTNTLVNLTDESKTTLMKFYSTFIYKTINKNDRGNEDLSEFLLDKISDPEYIKSLGLETKTTAKITSITGEETTIADFISFQNKTICYDSLLKLLSGESYIDSETFNTVQIVQINHDTPKSSQDESFTSVNTDFTDKPYAGENYLKDYLEDQH